MRRVLIMQVQEIGRAVVGFQHGQVFGIQVVIPSSPVCNVNKNE